MSDIDTRTLDDLINAPHPPIPAVRPIAHRAAPEPVGDWSLGLTLVCIVPVGIAVIVLTALLIVQQVKW